MSHCDCAEEGTRNVVAECLGKLTLLQPESLLNRLQSQLCEFFIGPSLSSVKPPELAMLYYKPVSELSF